MNHRRWQKIKEILDQASRLDLEARARYVESACGDDGALRAEVESLLAFDDSGETLERPIFDVNAEDPAIGRRIGHYRILQQLGRGGMGEVYLARRENDYSQQVAIKLIRRGLDSDDQVARFHRERQILADLVHPSIARLLDGGTTEEGLPYLVMERVEGEPIDRYCDRRRLGVRERLELFRQVLDAVAASHRHLVVHRDLKPGNVLVTAGGSPKLIDFGIAKLIGRDLRTEEPPGLPGAGTGADAAITVPDERPMSPRYASPEQIRGEPITTASDVYSLGVLLYELLCGRSPCRDDGAERTRAIQDAELTPPSAAVQAPDGGGSHATPAAIARARGTRTRRLVRQLSGELDAVVLKAMHREAGRRYPSVEQLSDDVGRFLDGRPVAARESSFLYRLAKLARRRRRTLLAAALALAVAGSLATTLAVRARAEHERARAAAIGAFVDDLFWSAHPDRADGESLTVRELLERGGERLAEGLEDQPLVRAELLEVVGRVNKDLGNWRLAERQLTEALDLQRRHGPNDDALIARRANELAAVAQKQGDLDRAEGLYREALTRIGGCRSQHPDALWIAGNLAWQRTRGGDFGEAEALVECLRDRQRLGLAAGDPAVASVLNKVAALRFSQGQHPEAEELFRETLRLRRAHHGPLHTQVANALNNLGKVQQTMGKSAEAEEHLREALRIRLELLPGGHPHVANTSKNLALTLLTSGRAADAEPLARRAVEALRSMPASDPWMLADAENVLGASLAELGRCPEAARLLESSTLKIEQTAGGESPYAQAARRRLERFTEHCRPREPGP